MQKKSILLVPDTVIRRLRRNNVSLDILLSPELVTEHLSPSEVVTIEFLNTHIDRLLHESVADIGNNSNIRTRRWDYRFGDAIKFKSYVSDHLLGVNDGIPFSDYHGPKYIEIGYTGKYNNDTMKFFNTSVIPECDRVFKEKSFDAVLGIFKSIENTLPICERFTLYDNDTYFAVIGVTDGAFNTSGLESVITEGKKIPISMSLTKSFLKLVLGVLHIYSTKPEVAVTDVYGKYARLLAAEAL